MDKRLDMKTSLLRYTNADANINNALKKNKRKRTIRKRSKSK